MLYSFKFFIFNTLSDTERIFKNQVFTSDSIAGIRLYKYWPTNYRRFLLQEFYSFDRKFKVKIRK